MLQLSALSSAASQGMESHSSLQIALRSQWRQLALARGFCLLGRTQSRLWSLKKCSAFPLFLLPMGWGSCWGWLPHPAAFQCAAGWDHRCGQGGVGTSVSGAGTYQRAACAKQSTSFDVLGGRGGSANLLSIQGHSSGTEQSSAQSQSSQCQPLVSKPHRRPSSAGWVRGVHSISASCAAVEPAKGWGFFRRGTFSFRDVLGLCWCRAACWCYRGWAEVGWGNNVELHSLPSPFVNTHLGDVYVLIKCCVVVVWMTRSSLTSCFNLSGVIPAVVFLFIFCFASSLISADELARAVHCN